MSTIIISVHWACCSEYLAGLLRPEGEERVKACLIKRSHQSDEGNEGSAAE